MVIRVEHVDVAVCRSVAGELKNRLSRIPGLTAIGDSLRHGPLQLSVRAVEPECSEFGLTESDVAMSVRAAMEGVVAANLRNPHHQEELPIRVVLDQAWRKDLNDLMAIEIRTPTGASPLVQELVAPYYEQHYASMHHNNGRPSIVVSAEIQGKPVDASGRPIDVGYVHRELRDELAELESRHLGLKVVFGGGYAQRQATFGQLQLAGVLAAGLIYLVLVGQFRSYMQPFLILLTLLFSLIGVVAGLLAHDYAFSVVSAVALVGLFGVAVNDAILLISFLNDEPRGGPDRLQPVLAACRVRFRPILATTITTVAGLLPMAIGLRGYSPLWSPFAACFCYGLSAATLLTLAMVPCFYMIFEDVGRIPSWLWRSLRASDSSPTAPIAVNEES
ncbi:MAG: efflux RND transporter permease subunit [Planctomycetes bacterium]|nr:efflux RND transporter permease subunit [Planctomycetota bacterium]